MLEEQLRRTLDERARDFWLSRDLPDTLTRRMRRRVAATVLAGAVAVGAITAGGAYALSILSAPPQDDATSPSTDCPDSGGLPRGGRWTSPPAFVASGNEAGDDWILCARTAEFRRPVPRSAGERPERRIPRPITKEAMCLFWRFGQGLGSGYDCFVNTSKARNTDSVQVGWCPGNDQLPDARVDPVGSFYGTLPGETASVEIEIEGSEPAVANIHEAPPELESDEVVFFVGFVDRDDRVLRLVARDETGRIVHEEEAPDVC